VLRTELELPGEPVLEADAVRRGHDHERTGGVPGCAAQVRRRDAQRRVRPNRRARVDDEVPMPIRTEEDDVAVVIDAQIGTAAAYGQAGMHLLEDDVPKAVAMIGGEKMQAGILSYTGERSVVDEERAARRLDARRIAGGRDPNA